MEVLTAVEEARPGVSADFQQVSDTFGAAANDWSQQAVGYLGYLKRTFGARWVARSTHRLLSESLCEWLLGLVVVRVDGC